MLDVIPILYFAKAPLNARYTFSIKE